MNVSSPALTTDDEAPALNPKLDRAELAEIFRRKRRIHIPNILTDTSARRLAYTLERETPWVITFNEGEEHLDIDKVSPAEQQKMAYAAWNRAHTSFQFFHHRHRLSAAGEPYPDSKHYLAKLVAFLSSPHLMAFIRDVTGEDAIAWVNIMATLYKPLDFLTLHDDDVAGDRRLIAYVLNMTPVWRPDWGGALQFFDKQGNIEEGFMPTFNALNLFRVPMLHSVAQVAPFGGNRYSVTGWFHSGEPHPITTRG
jgi:Rps23 Pro-64 3,4-dihydroxylase Tpa1-like proline 4-hydroxylase